LLTKKVDAVQNVNLKILGVKEMTTSEIRKELEKLKGEIVTIKWSRKKEDRKRFNELELMQERYSKLKNTLEYIENQVQWNIGA
jgi:chromosome segregation ATPase